MKHIFFICKNKFIKQEPLEEISGGERIFEKIKINYKPNLIIYEKDIICTADAYCGKGERAE